LVSKNLSAIRLLPIEFEIGRETATERAQTFQEVVPSGFAGDHHFTIIRDMNFDFVASLEFQRLYHGGGDSDGEAMALSGDLHVKIL
jgi:hypothetical protein